jgi:cyclopropane fatty-acyl-phospholipid synthase-like methyltransferase
MRRSLVLTCLAVWLGTFGLARSAAAQLGAQPTEEWIRTLDAPARVAGLKVFQAVDKLGLKPGDVVADIGAGTGLFSIPMGQKIKPGKVYAVEVDEGLVNHIGEVATEQGMNNIVPIYGDYTDPLLPEPVDLALIADALHHIEKRQEYLKTLAGYIKPGGRVAIIEFMPGKGAHRDDPAMQVSRETATGWMADAGFKPVEDVPLYDDMYFVIFGKQ